MSAWRDEGTGSNSRILRIAQSGADVSSLGPGADGAAAGGAKFWSNLGVMDVLHEAEWARVGAPGRDCGHRQRLDRESRRK